MRPQPLRASAEMNITPLIDVLETRSDKTLFIMGAPSLRYGEIVDVIDAAKGAGLQRVGIVTDRMRLGGQ